MGTMPRLGYHEMNLRTPQELWDRFEALTSQQEPRRSSTVQINHLIKQWVDANEPAMTIPKKPRGKRKGK
jgi:hypothetical protein